MGRCRDYLTKGSKPDKDKYYMISLTCDASKNDANQLIYKTEIDSQIQKTNLRLSKGKVGNELGVWD